MSAVVLSAVRAPVGTRVAPPNRVASEPYATFESFVAVDELSEGFSVLAAAGFSVASVFVSAGAGWLPFPLP